MPRDFPAVRPGVSPDGSSLAQQHQQVITSPIVTSYVERRCALRWPLVMWGLGVPGGLVAVFIVLGVLINPEWFIAAVFTPLVLPFMATTALLYRNWPTGIRIDESGISIGAVGSRRAATRRPTVNHQNWGLFRCAWSDVREVTIVMDPVRIREIKKSPKYWTMSNHWGRPRGMDRCRAGVLTAPFMRAALLINVGYRENAVPDIRPARFFSNYMTSPRFSDLLSAEPSAEWVVPTRRPDDLRAFLAATGH